MKLKKVVSVGLMVSMLFSFAACADKKEDQKQEAQQQETQQQESKEEQETGGEEQKEEQEGKQFRKALRVFRRYVAPIRRRANLTASVPARRFAFPGLGVPCGCGLIGRHPL